ncbi:MAG: ribonuclease P protein component [Cryomorphaceae bacterium]
MNSDLDFSFPVEERLKHKKLFEQLFTTGQRLFKHPVLAVWSEVDLSETVPFQVGFVAPKKHYKTAVERNRIKRWMREAFRTQNSDLKLRLTSSGKQIAVLFITVKSDNISYELLRPKILLLLQEIGLGKHGK